MTVLDFLFYGQIPTLIVLVVKIFMLLTRDELDNFGVCGGNTFSVVTVHTIVTMLTCLCLSTLLYGVWLDNTSAMFSLVKTITLFFLITYVIYAIMSARKERQKVLFIEKLGGEVC